MLRPAPRRCTAPGSPAWRSLWSAWRCTTSSATCSGALSICRTPRCTRSSCRTRPHTTAQAHPRQLARIARALAAEEAAGGLFDLAAALGAKQSLAAIGLRERPRSRRRPRRRSPYPNPTPLTREPPPRPAATRSMAGGRRLIAASRTRWRTTAPAHLRPWRGSRALDAEDAAAGLFDLAPRSAPAELGRGQPARIRS